MKTKKHDFIELDYTGYIENAVFDTTSKEIAKKEKIVKEDAKYVPSIICVGERWVIKGLDDALNEKEINKEYEVTLQPEDAFGKKDAKLIQIVPTLTLTKQNIRPFPGLQIYAGNLMGIIRTVSGGRTTIDFNHPLAGKIITYKFKINKIITKNLDKVQGMMEFGLGLNDKEFTVKETNNKISIKLKPKIPADTKNNLVKKAKEFGLEVTFEDN